MQVPSNTNEIHTAKSILRRAIGTKLKQLNASQIKDQSNAIQAKLVVSEEFRMAKRVGLYLSVANLEVDTTSILKQIFRLGKQCFIPQFFPNTNLLKMVQLYSMHDFESLPMEAKWKIKQPPIDDNQRPEALSTGGLDLLLMPGVAFTRDGLRLGHGKGYFDRWLSQCFEACQADPSIRRPITIGLAFDEQIVDRLPISEHDVAIDKVLSPS